MPRRLTPINQRIATKIEVSQLPEGDWQGPHWLWTAGKTSDGYSRIGVAGRGTGKVAVHIHLWTQKHGPVPEGLELDHLCRIRHCVNPDHLEPVTHRENVLRGNYTKPMDTCQFGHNDWYIYYPARKKGRPARSCNTCNKIRRHNRYLRLGHSG